MKIRSMITGGLTALLCLLAACAPAQSYLYGGSADDILGEIAVGSDGRMVMTGFTNSADGTLSARTKKGRSGWALCIGADGEVLWSFVSRLGSHDIMSSPVFHEDGSVTLVLEAETDVSQEMEAIRLDREGNVLNRKTMQKTGGAIEYLWVAPPLWHEGYVLEEMDDKAGSVGFSLYDYDGKRIAQLSPEQWHPKGRAHAAGERHAIRIAGGEGTLYALEESGEEKKLATVFEVSESGRLGARYNSLISLPDGGAAGCGWVLSGDTRKGLISRWDAEGALEFEMWLEIGQLYSMVKTDSGFAASCWTGEENDAAGENQSWEVVYFDEMGSIVRREALEPGEAPTSSACNLALLPDGRIAAVQNFETGRGGIERDIRVTILE